MATGWAPSTKENLNFARLCRLLIDGGTRVLRHVFDTKHSPSTLHTVLHSPPVHNLLQGLRARRVITVHQWERLYPRTTPVISGGFDITLLSVLLRNICNLTPPPTGWDIFPADTDQSNEADLVRIKLYRNEVYGHITQTAVSDVEFERLWTKISAVLIRRQPLCKPDIDRLKVERMDIDDQKHFIKALEEWEEIERSIKTAIKDSEQRVMGKLEDIEGKLGSKEKTIKDSEQRVMGKLEDIEAKLDDVIKEKAAGGDSAQSNVGRPTNQPAAEKDDVSSRAQGGTNVTYIITIKDDAKVAVGDNAQVTNVENPANQPTEKDHLSSKAQEYTRKLKSSIKRQTESLPALEGQTAVSIDDVFTNVTIQREEKYFKKDQEKRTYGREQFDVFQASSTTLKNRSEMFIWPENDPKCRRSTNPKCILITGVAGIGKSEYLKKVIWDWADDQLLKKDPKYPDFQFAFKLKFSQLGILDHEELDLCDILNRSSLLDEQSIIDKGLLQYMIENLEKVLIIFDGYDEYPYRTEITGNLEEKYPNDPCQKMPVPVMIAKIMKGKIFRDSVVMISSRPQEAQELLLEKNPEVKKFPFDVKCQIQGFSSLQVQEFIQKYFKDHESIKKKVLEHIKMNEILLSFGRIPVMCYLMCYYLKWHMSQSKTTENLPNTRSQLYYEVIKAFITRHSSSKYKKMTESEVKEILHKLAELAIYLMSKRKIIFTEEDMMKSFKFSEQELTNLKKSGLFDCFPGVKKSPFDKPALQFVFSHLTMQEFLCALGFVEKKQLPEKEGTSEVIWTFMAGLLRRKNDEKLMDQLIEKIKPQDKRDKSYKLLTLHCLYEYKDNEFSKTVINKLHDKYWYSDGRISFFRVNDLDCLAIGYFLDIVKLLNVEHTTKLFTSTRSFIGNTLYIGASSLSPSGVSVLCESLSNSTFVTGLWLMWCRLDDECVKIIAQTLNNTRITILDLPRNNITDEGVMCVCDVVSKRDCPVKLLNLLYNDKITNECQISARKLLKLNKPDVKLWI